MANSTKLSLPLVAASQAQKHVTVNETFLALDIIVQLNVLDRNLAAPPGSPVEGDAYIVAASPTGAWAGKANQIAAYQGGGWVFYVPREGWNAWVRDENVPLVYDGTNWSSLIAAGGGLTVASLNDGSTVTLLGIGGATADTTNRLSVNADGVLFNQDGSGGFNLTLNKAATGDTLAITMQTGFSTRALVGLLANNDFAIRTSADGTTFFNALTLAAGSGAATFASVVRASDGSAAAPAWSFGADTDNGFYRIGTNSIGLSVGGTLRLTCATTAFTFASTVTVLSAAQANITGLYLGLGGATADATNRLSVNTPAVLLNNAGAGIDMTFNKNAAGDDASMSFKTAFTSYALIGLLANNDFTIKVGTGFLTALQINNTTGEVDFSYPMVIEGQPSAPAAPPTGSLKLYARDRAGTQFLDVMRPSGRDFPLQPHFGVNRIAFWAPSTTTTVTAVGMPVTNVGTVSTPTPASTNLKASMRRWTLTSAAVINSVSDQRSAVNACWRGNAAGIGGFNYTNRIALTTLQATGMAFFGLYGSTAALATTLLLSGVVNCIGIGFQRGTHTNWQLVQNDAAGAPTLTDLGASFPINTTDVLTLYICAAPNGSDIGVRVINETSGATFDTTVSSNIPANTVFLSPRNYMNNNVTAAAVAFDCAGVYLETDY